MFWLAYVSSATQPFTKQELVDLLATSRENNSRIGITGMLLYRGGNFMQVLEGEEQAVRNLYGRICRDPRHHGQIVIDEGSYDERQFAEWSMGFRNLSDEDVLALPGFNPFMNVQLGAEEFQANPGLCWGLLDLFRKRVI
jgi:hypothetical protein